MVSGCKKLHSISGLSNSKNLVHVDLNQTGIDDLTALAGATKLRALKIRATKVTSLAPVLACKNLEILYAEKSKLKSIEGLGESLGKLKLLWLHLTAIKDLTPLQGLTALLELDISGVKAKDFSAIAELKSLRFLDLYETVFDDLDILEELPNLEIVRLGKTKIDHKDPRIKKLNKRMIAKHGKHAGLSFDKPSGGLTQLRESDAFCCGDDLAHHELNLCD